MKSELFLGFRINKNGNDNNQMPPKWEPAWDAEKEWGLLIEREDCLCMFVEDKDLLKFIPGREE
jgi:hypothetical protein